MSLTPAEQMFEQEVTLVCDECGEKSDNKLRDELVDEGWNWCELEINELGEVRIVHCPDCFDAEKMKEEVNKYKEDRVGDSGGMPEEQTKLHNVGGGGS